ncbi:HNH endonuclease [Photobacterium profundum]|uniref:HNH endonuclease n=1 Tax=Photobacterium profundum TaxID=74109 RepID=UPI003D099789
MYWWVNHKQTHSEEIGGGYIWSPKKNTNGAKNNSYDNMAKTSVGDTVFSFAYAEIKAIGEVVESCCSAPKPDEFGNKGDYWNDEGWLVKVKWTMLEKPFRAKDHIVAIAPLLPGKYSPIQINGNGNQSCYLASISTALALVLFDLSGIGIETKAVIGIDEDIEKRELAELKLLEQDTTIDQAEKEQLVKSRRGQGKYRRNLELIESCCRVTGLSDKRFLVASHSKPWCDSTKFEKLDGNNGFLLSPHIDRLFDRGWISFKDDGELLIAEHPVIDVLKSWGVSFPINIGLLNDKQKTYLNYHRDFVFKSISFNC